MEETQMRNNISFYDSLVFVQQTQALMTKIGQRKKIIDSWLQNENLKATEVICDVNFVPFAATGKYVAQFSNIRLVCYGDDKITLTPEQQITFPNNVYLDGHEYSDYIEPLKDINIYEKWSVLENMIQDYHFSELKKDLLILIQKLGIMDVVDTVEIGVEWDQEYYYLRTMRFYYKDGNEIHKIPFFQEMFKEDRLYMNDDDSVDWEQFLNDGELSDYLDMELGFSISNYGNVIERDEFIIGDNIKVRIES